MCSHQVQLLDRAGNIQQAEEEWTDHMKNSLLDIQLQNWNQPAFVPQLTPIGFKVMPVPSFLFNFLLDMLVMDKIKPESCAPSAHINCKEGEEPAKVEIVEVKNSQEVRRVLGEQLRTTGEEW